MSDERPPLVPGTLCKRGHGMTEETAFFASGLWQCKTCRSETQKSRARMEKSEAATIAAIFKDMSYVYTTSNNPAKHKTDTPRQAKWRSVFKDDPLKFVTHLQKLSTMVDKKSGDGKMDAGSQLAIDEADKVMRELGV